MGSSTRQWSRWRTHCAAFSRSCSASLICRNLHCQILNLHFPFRKLRHAGRNLDADFLAPAWEYLHLSPRLHTLFRKSLHTPLGKLICFPSAMGFPESSVGPSVSMDWPDLSVGFSR